MFEWSTAAESVTEGSLSPLAVVPELESLGDLDLLSLDAVAALAVVELVQAATSSLAAISALGMEALARRESEQVARERDDDRRRGVRGAPGPHGDDLAVASLAPVLHLTPRTTGTRLDEVRTLVNDLPRTFALVRAGRLDLHRAGAVAAESLLVAADRRAAFDEEVTAPPTGRRRIPLVDLTSGGVHKRAAGIATRVDPESAAARAEAAVRDRFVRVTPGTDPGVTSWSASLPSDGSLRAWAAVDALATRYASDDPARRIDQARADALLDLILGQATIRTTIELVVPLDPRWAAGTTGPATTTGATTTGATTATHATTTTAATTSTHLESGVAPAIDAPTTTDPPPPTCPPPPTSTPAPEPSPAGLPGARRRSPWRRDRKRPLSPWERHLRLVITETGAGLSPHVDATPAVDDLPGCDNEHQLHEPPTDEDCDEGWALPVDAPAETTGDDTRGAVAATPGTPGSSLVAQALVPTCEVGVRHPRVGILLNAAVTAWLSDPDTRLRLHGCDLRTGALVVHDPTVYRPNERLARIVRARDGHCRFPGCGTDAPRCQLDHVKRFPDGPTTLDNLVCLCASHHAFKHSSGWTLSMEPDGTCTWRTPLGRTHVTTPRTVSELVA